MVEEKDDSSTKKGAGMFQEKFHTTGEYTDRKTAFNSYFKGAQ